MTEKGIFSTINEKLPAISESDIPNLLPELFEHYKPSFKSLAYSSVKNTSETVDDLFFKSFSARAEEKIKEAVTTYIKNKKWETNPNLQAYIGRALKNFSNSMYWDLSSKKKKTSFICAYCKNKNNAKEILLEEGSQLKCNWCSQVAEAIEENIKNGLSSNSDEIKRELSARKAFSLHGKKGYQCCSCEKFLPDTCVNSGLFICPYDNCGDFGPIASLKSMSHPLTITVSALSSASLISESEAEVKTISTASSLLELKEDYYSKLDLINSVIFEQIKKTKRVSTAGTVTQMLLMYEAFENATKKYPSDMIQYLCYQQVVSEPIQSKIFQEYVSLIEDALPFTLLKKGKEKSIISLTDPNLSLFMGISEFENMIDENLMIGNLTKERYIGGRSYKDYGPCFIGKLIDIKDVNNNSLIDNVKEYSFSRIWMTVVEPQPVKVTHFRIPSHYEMHSMVYLQKVRKELVNSLYFKINGEKRNVKMASK